MRRSSHVSRVTHPDPVRRHRASSRETSHQPNPSIQRLIPGTDPASTVVHRAEWRRLLIVARRTIGGNMFRDHANRSVLLISAAAAVLAVSACGRSNRSGADDALKNDLALASQAQAYQPQQFMSPTEQGMNPYANPYGNPAANSPYGYPQQVQTVARSPYPTTTRRSRSSGVSRSAGSSGTYSRQPAEPVRNTKRDAVIGAAAGAVLGASTSRDKMKGAIIGAAAGGILGGIIGHTVDVKNP
jgi:YmgG-like glycine-zipper protein